MAVYKHHLGYCCCNESTLVVIFNINCDAVFCFIINDTCLSIASCGDYFANNVIVCSNCIVVDSAKVNNSVEIILFCALFTACNYSCEIALCFNKFKCELICCKVLICKVFICKNFYVCVLRIICVIEHDLAAGNYAPLRLKTTCGIIAYNNFNDIFRI